MKTNQTLSTVTQVNAQILERMINNEPSFSLAAKNHAINLTSEILAEHAALQAVAEAANEFPKAMDGELDADQSRYVVACKNHRKALTNLAAVRNGKGGK